MGREDVSFYPGGIRCAAWLYRPDGASDAAVPCVVMGHGFSAVRDQRLGAFAERFAAAGLAALVFDYRHFGDSEGEPRQLLDIGRQHQDWHAAVAFARAQPGIDPDRIVVWGTSFSGGHALTVAAADARVAAAVAQGPFMDGRANLLHFGPRKGPSLVVAGLRDQVGAWLGRPPYLLPAVGAPGSGAVIATPDAESGFASVTAEGSTWRNEVAARIALRVAFYRPVAKARNVACPILFCIMDDDVITPPAPARAAAAAAPRGEVRQYPGRHFDVYTGDTFELVVADQLDFLKRHVL